MSITVPDVAKRWKNALRKQWPQIRWSVRTAPRGYFEVVTRWHDGPTRAMVTELGQQWAESNPDAAGPWMHPAALRRDYSPAGYTTVIDAIIRDIPDMPIPRTPDGGLDIRAARAVTRAGPVRVAGRWYGRDHVYDLVAIVELVAAHHDYTTMSEL
ncbi:LPD29 domain-containing protein [Nocardia sp. BMG111209]|uniref:LPD29 domain-containing protein n=1 Tax=Nocardia sp. BMG111209 TaxID=1160137 RepID=UPI000362166F|nr:LPD29 domain-containing protein [Nocardia sp. BMG111209]